jgi:hypothetical protein
MKNNGGFSLIEILIVFGIIGTILAIIVGNVTSGSEAAKKKETILKVSNIQAGLIRFQQDMGKIPETAEGINGQVLIWVVVKQILKMHGEMLSSMKKQLKALKSHHREVRMESLLSSIMVD